MPSWELWSGTNRNILWTIFSKDVDASCLSLKNAAFWKTERISRRSFAFFLSKGVYTWTPSSWHELLVWTSTEKQFRTSSVSCMLRASPNLTAWKSFIVLMYHEHGVRTDILCRTLLMSFPSGLSQQYYVTIEKQLTFRFNPVLQGNIRKQTSSILDNFTDTAPCRTLIFSTLQSVEDVRGIPARTFTIAIWEHS